MAVVGTLTAVGAGGWFTPTLKRGINCTCDGSFVAAVQLERSFDGGVTPHVVIPDSLRTNVPPSFSLEEAQVGVCYRWNCTAYTSGTVTYRLEE